MENHEIKQVIEAVLFISDQPQSLAQLGEILKGVETEKLSTLLAELKEDYDRCARGMQIVEVAGGSQLVTRPEVGQWMDAMNPDVRKVRLSKPALETLAIVAYKQPLTRAEVEAIRGVDAAGVVKTLLERNLIKMVGRKEIPGRPILYGTTREFLETFGLPDLAALPTLKEWTEVAEMEPEEIIPGESVTSFDLGSEGEPSVPAPPEDIAGTQDV